MCGDYPAPHNLHKTIPRRTTAYPTPDLTFPHRITITMHPSHLTPHRIASHHTISLHISHPILSIPSHHFTSLLLSLPPLSSHPIPLGLLNYMFHNIQMRQSELDRYLCYQKRLLRRLKRIEEEKKVVYLIKLTMPDYLFLMSMIDYDSTDQVSFVISLRATLYNILLYRMNVSPSHTNLF